MIVAVYSIQYTIPVDGYTDGIMVHGAMHTVLRATCYVLHFYLQFAVLQITELQITDYNTGTVRVRVVFLILILMIRSTHV